jgi:hypothetical protein
MEMAVECSKENIPIEYIKKKAKLADKRRDQRHYIMVARYMYKLQQA